tara:strand:+ start:1939 stop:2919 length:981 start_codon:yes stop_codon:yes gene_type:complete
MFFNKMATPNDKDDQPPKTPGKSSAPAGESKTPASGNTTVEYIKIEEAKEKLQSDMFDALNEFNNPVEKSFTFQMSNAQKSADHFENALMPMLYATRTGTGTESTDSGKKKIRLTYDIKYKTPSGDITLPETSLLDDITLRVKRTYLFLFKKTIEAIQNSRKTPAEKANLRILAALRMHAMITYYHELRKQASPGIKDVGYSDDGGDFGDGGFGDGQSVVLNDDVMDDINAAVNADDMLQAALLSVFGKLMEGMTAEKSRGALKRAFERYDKKNIDKMDAAALEGDAAPAGGGGGGGSGGGGGAAPAGGGSGGGDNLHSYLKQLRL